jgi:hypothetical protein
MYRPCTVDGDVSSLTLLVNQLTVLCQLFLGYAGALPKTTSDISTHPHHKTIGLASLSSMDANVRQQGQILKAHNILKIEIG